MTGEQLKGILKRLEVSRTPLHARELIGFKAIYAEDVPVLLAEIERLHKIIDSKKETTK